jgi:hypothetical protein
MQDFFWGLVEPLLEDAGVDLSKVGVVAEGSVFEVPEIRVLSIQA